MVSPFDDRELVQQQAVATRRVAAESFAAAHPEYADIARQHAAAVRRHLDAVRVADVLTEARSAEPMLAQAVHGGDERMAGAILIEIATAIAMRRADVELYGTPRKSTPTIEQAAAMAVLRTAR
jgi:hypothetical protein